MRLQSIPLSVLFCIMFVIGCSDTKEEQPQIFKDDAILVSIDFTDAIALISVTRSDKEYQVIGNIGYEIQELLRLNSDNTTTNVSFTITGNPTGGFEYYRVIDVDHDHFLISFYRREQSYFIAKATGKAALTAYVPAENLYQECKTFNNSFYYFREKQIHVVSNYLNFATLEDKPLSINSSPSEIFFDNTGNIYFLSSYDLYSVKNNTEVKLTTDYIHTWMDVNNDLRTVDLLGYVSKASDGNLLPAGKLKNKPFNRANTLTSYNFSAYRKTLGLLLDDFGRYSVYDLLKTELLFKFEENDLPQGFQFLSGDATGKYLNFMFYKYPETLLSIQIDITTNSIIKNEKIISQDSGDRNLLLTSINKDLCIVQTCTSHGSSCSKTLKFLRNGSLSEIFSEHWTGTVIKLND